MNKVYSWLYVVVSTATAMIGYNIHHNWFYSILDFIFTPIAWIWWLINHDVNLTIIKDTFSFFFK